MRVLVVDDHEVVRRGVRSLLSQSNYDVCGEAVDGRDALEKARQLKPDVIVMDVSMPNRNGLEATREIRSVLPDSEVLMLSQHNAPAMVREAFKAGARGYVVKSSMAKDLLTALDKVSRHETFFDRAITEIADESGHTDAHEILLRSATLEQALRESEELYRSTFELAELGVAHASPDGRWLRVNDKLCKIVGYSQDELLKLRFQDITHPDDLAADLAQAEKMRTGLSDTYSNEKRYIRKDGSAVWVSLRVSPVRDKNHELKYFITVVEDITERREAEQAKFRLAAIVESSDDAIISKDLNGIITSWNKAAERLFGYTAEEAIGQHITLIIPADRRNEEVDILSRLRQGQRIDHFETIRQCKAGMLMDISLTISPVRDAAGRVVGASKVARDITSRKRNEKALATGARQQTALFHLADELHRAASVEEVYRAALDAISTALQCDRAAILLCDDAGLMRFVSWRELSDRYRAAVEGHSAWSPDETNPQPVCIGDIDSANIGESLKASVKSEGIGALAFIPLVSKDKLIGKFMTYFNAPHTFIPDELAVSLTIAHQLAFAIDRKRSDEALRLSEERLRRLSETLDAEVRARTNELEDRNAHVLRQSEQVRNLSWRLMRTQDEERRHIARELHDTAGQTLTVIGMDLAQLVHDTERAAPQLAKEGEKIQELVQQLHREIRTTSYLLHPPLLDESGLSSALNLYVDGVVERSDLAINLGIADDFGRLPKDMELVIFRLIQECLTNIHRHSGSKTATIRVAREGESVCLEVRDQGKGISPERLAEIQSQGSGVGISGMRERLRQFHGELNIESSSSGTRIFVSIPIPKEVHSTDIEPLQAAV